MSKETANTVIDWKLSTTLAGNKDELARDMLALLVKALPGEMSNIRHAKENHQIPELLRAVHKLHGAACYCGVPRLKNVLATFETSLKEQHTDTIDKHFAELELAASQVLEAAAHLEH